MFKAKCNAPRAEGEQAELLIYGDIGENWWEPELSVGARTVVEFLAALPPSTPVLVRINSYGGSVVDAMAIVTALLSHKGVVTTQVDGIAFSCASLVFMAGERRLLGPACSIMVHAPWINPGPSNASELRNMAEVLDVFAEEMVSTYALGVDEAMARSWLTDGEDHFFTSQESLDLGLATGRALGVALAVAAQFRDNRFTVKSRGNTKMPGEQTVNPAEILAAERSRVSSLQTLAAQYGASPEMISKAIEAGLSPEDFELQAARAKIAAMAASPKPTEPPQPLRAHSSGSDGRIEPVHARGVSLRGVYATERQAFTAGQWVRAMVGGHRGAADWLYQHTGLDIRGTSLTSIGTGGALIPTELENAIVDLREEYGVLRRAARVTAMGSDTLSRPIKRSGLTAVPLGEAATMTAEDLSNQWGKSNLIARKWGVLVRYPSEIQEDAVIDMGVAFAGDVAMAFSEAEDTAGFDGDGTSAYHGILGFRNKIILAAHAASVVSATGNTYESVTLTDIAKLISRVPKRFRRNAGFVCSRVGYQMTLGRLKMAAGGNTARDLESADTEVFLRYPVYETETFSSALTSLAGEVLIAFGDIRSACDLGNRRGIRILESRERFIESDELALQATERFDINWHSMGDTTDPGPVAALLGAT